MTTVVNIKKTKRYDVYIGRGGPWGNPFDFRKLGITRKECIELYKEWFYKKLLTDRSFYDNVHTLKDKVLGCYCKPETCHGDIIVEYLENEKQSIHTDRVVGSICNHNDSDRNDYSGTKNGSE